MFGNLQRLSGQVCKLVKLTKKGDNESLKSKSGSSIVNQKHRRSRWVPFSTSFENILSLNYSISYIYKQLLFFVLNTHRQNSANNHYYYHKTVLANLQFFCLRRGFTWSQTVPGNPKHCVHQSRKQQQFVLLFKWFILPVHQ